MAAVPQQCLQSPPASLAVAPQSFRVQGRHRSLENTDICGEYNFIKRFDGYPAYENGTGIVIRIVPGSAGMAPPMWVMQRGYSDHNVSVAYAETSLERCCHPANPNLVWKVWDSRKRAHVEDREVYAIDAPDEFTFVGRAPERENACVNGKYFFKGVAYGRAMYHHEREDLALSYNDKACRWQICAIQDVGSVNSCAWADGANTTSHPLETPLAWNFFEPTRGDFAFDSDAGVIDAPEMVTVRGPQQQPPSICCGAYQLVGMVDGKPCYQNPHTQATIRYSSQRDWWMIQEGMEGPGFGAKVVSWLMSGNPDDAQDRCFAWAKANQTDHPGHLNLTWAVWDSLSSLHRVDREFACTSAPMLFSLTGRNVNKENEDIFGEYKLASSDNAFPVYVKPGTQTSIYLSRRCPGRWVIDRNGVADNGVCVAFAETSKHSDYPRQVTWQVHVAARSSFVVDASMRVEVPPTAFALGQVHAPQVPTMPDAMLGGFQPCQEPPVYCGNKRMLMEPENLMPCFLEDPHAKRARRGNGPGWFSKFFGGGA